MHVHVRFVPGHCAQVRRAKERSVVEREGAVLSAERKLRDVQVRAGRPGWALAGWLKCAVLCALMYVCMYVGMPRGLELEAWTRAGRGRL